MTQEKDTRKYQLRFRLERLPGVGTINLVAGECEADTPFEAGKKLEGFLQSRLGRDKYRYIAEAKIVDDKGEDRALLQIDTLYKKVDGLDQYVPSWGNWLTIRKG